MIFEVTQDVIRAGFAFGLLPGWWLSMCVIHPAIQCLNMLKVKKTTGDGDLAYQQKSGTVYCAELDFREQIWKFPIISMKLVMNIALLFRQQLIRGRVQGQVPRTTSCISQT